MKISTKIYGGFSLMLVIMLVIVGTFYYQYQIVEKLNSNMINYRAPLQSHAQDLALGAAREAAAIRGYLATGNPKFKKDLDQAMQEVEANLSYLNEKGKIKEVLKPVNDANTKFIPHLKKMIELYDTQGQFAAAVYMSTYAAPDNAAFLGEIDKYVDRQEQSINDDKKKITEQEGTMLTSVLTILFIGIFLGGASSLLITRPILKSIDQGVDYAQAMAQGQFNQQLEVKSNDEMGILLQNLNTASASLRSLIKQVAISAQSVAASSEELNASAEQSAQAANQVAITITEVADGTEKQVYAINMTTGVVETMSASIKNIAMNANVVAGISGQTADSAREGGKAIQAAMNQMSNIEQTVINSAQVVSKLGERSNQIGQIVDTISGIAGQTNLLALNAAIEAARAGEEGRGFAVVAEEVRKLAEQSQEAAKQIATLITEIQTDTDKAVIAMGDGTREVQVGTEVVNTAGSAFEHITILINQVSDQIKNISAAIQEMASGSQQIVASVHDVETISKENAGQTQTVSAATEEQSASMEEIASASQALAKMAEELQTATRKFTI
ncbi:methyl-accepting chemotaxis protein [Pelosinus sp. sgz500959]|uniref:methyl-accepting chemotaxis protein n=1 Tax=Pelosinus sp. sgz500959 TaxID=3242472 RepID=UPI00366FF8E4